MAIVKRNSNITITTKIMKTRYITTTFSWGGGKIGKNNPHQSKNSQRS